MINVIILTLFVVLFLKVALEEVMEEPESE